MDNYFRLLFQTSLFLLPISLCLFILLKLDILKKGDPAKDKYLSFTKKLIVFSFFGGILTYFITTNDSKSTGKPNREGYVDQCVSEVSINLNADQKRIACEYSHDFLFKKYGNEIYKAGTPFTFEDKREMVIFFLKAKKPNLSDSLINDFRNNITTETQISSAIREVEDLK